MFYAHSPEALRDLRVPQSILAHMPQLNLVTSLLDMQVYVFRWGEQSCPHPCLVMLGRAWLGTMLGAANRA